MRDEEELRKYRDHLEELVVERTAQLQTALAQLQQETTERKLAEQALQEQLRFSQLLIDTIPNPIFYKNEKGLYQGCNAAFEAYTGLTKEKIIGKTVYGISPKNLADIYDEMDSLLLSKSGVQVYEASVLYSDGTIHDVIFNKATFLNTDGNVAGLVGVMIDITERKQAEEALRESEERYRRLVELSPDKISVHSEGKIVFINNAGAKLLGVESPEELIGKPVLDFIHPDHRKIVKERVRQMQEDGKTAPLIEEKFIRSDGTAVDVEVVAVPLTFQGKPAIQVVARDITQRKLAEEALEAERRRLFSLLDGLPALIYLQAPDYSIRFSNRYFWERFGKPGKRTCYEVLHGRKEPCKECPTFRVFETKIPLKWNSAESDCRIYQFYTYPFSDVDGSPLLLVMGIDITDRKQTEKEIAHLDRLHLIGEMAAGIGHEIRNPMTTVRGFLQMLENKDECAKYKEYYALMIEELDRANSIISEFLSLAKNKAVNLKAQNLNSIIEALSPLIIADAMVHDKFVKVELGNIPDILQDEKEIRQLILNLVRNGLEAMSPGGNLTIRTLTDDEDVVLSVQDQGKGIDPEVLEKIGTPFFTTKEQGTGLGLAVCYSIAARHNATIKVETGSMGTTFLVGFRKKSL